MKLVHHPPPDQMVRHHIQNKVNGGSDEENNLLEIKMRKHNAFHVLFKNLSLLEASELLRRVARAKFYERRLIPRMRQSGNNA